MKNAVEFAHVFAKAKAKTKIRENPFNLCMS